MGSPKRSLNYTATDHDGMAGHIRPTTRQPVLLNTTQNYLVCCFAQLRSPKRPETIIYRIVNGYIAEPPMIEPHTKDARDPSALTPPLRVRKCFPLYPSALL